MILTEERTAAADMVATGDEQASAIQCQIDAVTQAIDAATAERVALAEARAQREQALVDASRVAALAEQAHRQAVDYAALATGTGNEQQAIGAASAAKKAMQAARKDLAQMEREAREAEQVAAVQDAEIGKHLHLLTAERETHQAEHAAVTRGLAKAREELGSERYTDAVARYQEQAAAVAVLREQFIDAQVQLHDAHAEAVAALAHWPDLQRAVKLLRTPEDATARMIENTLCYLDALIKDAGQVRNDLPFPTGSLQGSFVWHLLFVREQELRNAASARDRRDLLARTLEQYRAWLAQRP